MNRSFVKRNTDVVLALFVVAITTMLLIPLPTRLLDFLLASNIAFSLLLLLVGLYMPNALALLAFPSLLLLTTLFRLSLNVASSRLILTQGDAGRVIEAFGTFLIRGEVVVGVIIFTIITIVNFIVIARGSSRVSEVAARFALDALPGKQMAIDADLRAGLITAEQAQAKRDDLRKESQLYGAMDGAMRFVQGDAIAGFFIILANIVGGLYVGLSQGLGFGDAIETFTKLTVGDGLVSQIPALMTSICAGIVVTRVSSSDEATLGSDVAAQVFGRPGTLMMTGGLLVFMGALPGIPWLPFMTVGLLGAGGGLWLKRSEERESALPALSEFSTTPLLSGARRSAPHSQRLLAAPAEEGPQEEGEVVMRLDAAALSPSYRLRSSHYQAWWRELQHSFFEETGLRLPPVQVVADDTMPVGRYAVELHGTTIHRGQVVLDCVLLETAPESAEILGVEVRQEAEHPLDGSRIFWTPQVPLVERLAEAGQVRTFDFFQVIGLRTTAFLRRAPEEVLSLTDVHNRLKAFEKKHPGLLSESVNRVYLTLPRLTEILQELARHGINVRDLRQIIEAIAGYCSSAAGGLGADDQFDVHQVVSYVRTHRRRQILSSFLTPRSTLKALVLSPEVEEILADARQDGDGSFVFDSIGLDRLRKGLGALVDPICARGFLPVVVVCRSELLRGVQQIARYLPASLGIVAFEELDPSVRIESVGVWGA